MMTIDLEKVLEFLKDEISKHTNPILVIRDEKVNVQGEEIYILRKKILGSNMYFLISKKIYSATFEIVKYFYDVSDLITHLRIDINPDEYNFVLIAKKKEENDNDD